MGRAAMIILVFVIVGPLIGLATLSALLSVFAAANIETTNPEANPAALGAFVMIYGILFAHFFGALWAAVAGALVAVRAHLWGPGSALEGVFIGSFTALASIVTWDMDELGRSSLGDIEATAAAGWALVHIVPAMICIWLTRRWQSRPAKS